MTMLLGYGTGQYSIEPYGSVALLDITPPAISNMDPQPGAMNVPIDKVLFFDITDVSVIHPDTISVIISGADAYKNETFHHPYNGGFSLVTPISGGLRFTIQKTSEWEPYGLIPVRVFAEDILGNRLSYTYSFRIQDALGPLVTPVSPTNHQYRVSVSTNVTLTITDESLLEDNSISVEIDQGDGFELAYEEGGSPEFKPGWDGPASNVSAIPGGVVIVIDPLLPFPSSSLIKVRVTAYDQWGNPERL